MTTGLPCDAAPPAWPAPRVRIAGVSLDTPAVSRYAVGSLSARETVRSCERAHQCGLATDTARARCWLDRTQFTYAGNESDVTFDARAREKSRRACTSVSRWYYDGSFTTHVFFYRSGMAELITNTAKATHSHSRRVSSTRTVCIDSGHGHSLPRGR